MQPQSKKNKHGKGLGKMLDTYVDLNLRYSDKDATASNNEATKFPGAYKNGIEVLGLMRDNQTWKIAEILDIREAKFFKE
jgi:hypothetical protein